MNNWNVSSVSVFASAKGLYLDRYYYSQDRWNEKSAKPNSIPGKSILHLLISVGKIHIRSTKHLYSLFPTLTSISSRTKLFPRLIGRKPPVLRADVVIVTQKTENFASDILKTRLETDPHLVSIASFFSF